jgi:drug/metabolite transporter (DMT)-like permease
MSPAGDRGDIYMEISEVVLKKGYLYIAATAFLFSTAEIAAKMVADQLNPFQLVFLRFFIGGVFLLPFALRDVRRRGLKLGVKDWLFFALTGFVGVAVSMSLFQLSVLYASASAVAVIFSTNTIFTSLFAVLVLKERFQWSAALAIALGLAGVACILNPFSLSPDILGMALALVSAAVFALYGVISTAKVAKYGGFILNSFSFLAGVLMMLPVMLLCGVPVVSGINSGNILIVLYNGIFVTGLGYFCYLSAMQETSAIQTSAVFFIKPALAPLLAMAVLGDALGLNFAYGVALIIAGAFVMFWRKRASNFAL